MKTAYAESIRSLLDQSRELTDEEHLTILALEGLGREPLEPEKKRQPYDEFYIWQRKNYWSGGLGE